MASPDGHVVARIGKPHALRGEVTVQLHTDDPESRLLPGTVFDTRAQPGSGVPRQLTLATTRVHRGIWLLGFEEIPDRTGAESLRGTRLVLAADQPDAATETFARAIAIDPQPELLVSAFRARLRNGDGEAALVVLALAMLPRRGGALAVHLGAVIAFYGVASGLFLIALHRCKQPVAFGRVEPLCIRRFAREEEIREDAERDRRQRFENEHPLPSGKTAHVVQRHHERGKRGADHHRDHVRGHDLAYGARAVLMGTSESGSRARRAESPPRLCPAAIGWR